MTHSEWLPPSTPPTLCIYTSHLLGHAFSALCPVFKAVMQKPFCLSSWHFGSLPTHQFSFLPLLHLGTHPAACPTLISSQHLPPHLTHTSRLWQAVSPTSIKGEKKRSLYNRPTAKHLLLCAVPTGDHTDNPMHLQKKFQLPAIPWNNNWVSMG